MFLAWYVGVISVDLVSEVGRAGSGDTSERGSPDEKDTVRFHGVTSGRGKATLREHVVEMLLDRRPERQVTPPDTR